MAGLGSSYARAVGSASVRWTHRRFLAIGPSLLVADMNLKYCATVSVQKCHLEVAPEYRRPFSDEGEMSL